MWYDVIYNLAIWYNTHITSYNKHIVTATERLILTTPWSFATQFEAGLWRCHFIRCWTDLGYAWQTWGVLSSQNILWCVSLCIDIDMISSCTFVWIFNPVNERSNPYEWSPTQNPGIFTSIHWPMNESYRACRPQVSEPPEARFWSLSYPLTTGSSDMKPVSICLKGLPKRRFLPRRG